jgi:glycerol-3-phosphate acyltransferase PlsY
MTGVVDLTGPLPTALAVTGAVVLGYLLGSINPAATFARLRNTDLRSVGSGNPGATNAARAFGLRVGVVVALLDMLKGFVPVVVFGWLFGPGAAAVAGIAAVLGHVTSPFLRGRGGKGVATSLGAVLGFQPIWALPVLAVFAVTIALTRRVGVSAVIACLLLVPCALVWDGTWIDVAFAAAITAVIVVRHRVNLRDAARPEDAGPQAP